MEAVSASLGVFGPLLSRLNSLLADECVRLKSVRHEIQSLSFELIAMQAAVQEYSNKQGPSVKEKAWMSLVRELAYDTEDLIDKFVHHHGNDSHNHGGFKDLFLNTARRLKNLGPRHRIANKIGDLKARAKQVKELKSSYVVDGTAGSTFEHSAVDPRLSSIFDEKQLVGIDGPRDDLVKWMMEEENCSTKHRKVLSIVGFGGLGKTTLAKEVCRSIQGHFHCQVFVSVSQKPNMKKIMKDVIFEVLGNKKKTTELERNKREEFIEDIDNWDVKKFIEKIRELLQDKRYLVTIDDIWSSSVWETIIQHVFPENNLSSRIIATTRIVDVAQSCCPRDNGLVYKMEALPYLHSKRLFFKRIFGSEDRCPDVLKDVSEKILKKCGGLPLAIISISSLLANRHEVLDEWEKVRRSIGSSLEKNHNLEGMNSILSLSYNDLPPNLKTCLLYLSIFPEDYVIDREILVRRWIAEGFISKERGLSKQEVAENYFYELINKSMVQPVAIGYDGKARACQVHDMMLELIISKSVEDNFISFAGLGQTDLVHRDGLLIRRLSVHYIDQELASVLANEDLSHIRSLTVLTSPCIKHLPSIVKFEALRALDFQGWQSLQEYDMNGIGKLFNLKYLSLRDTDISKLPSGILRLYGLETLDLRNTYITELPSEIVHLIELQHLLSASGPSGPLIKEGYGEGRTKIPDRIGNMKNLRVISGFNVTKSSLSAVDELRKLTALEELHIQLDGRGSQEYKRHEEMLLSSLGECNKLQSLRIIAPKSTPLQFLYSWSPPCSLKRFGMTTSSYIFPELPKWIAPKLTSLAYLDIALAEITEESLLTLGEIPALLYLELWFSGAPNERIIFRGHIFPCLKELLLVASSGYDARPTYLKFEEGALPELEKLMLSLSVSMAKAYGFNLGINHLPCLKHVTVALDNDHVTSSESKAAAAAIRNEANANPKHPRVFIYREMEENNTDEEES